MDKHRYELIVIGTGPAGEKGAAQAAYFIKKVTPIDRDYHLGGATASTTIPSKTLRETALTLSGIKARKLHGVDLSLRRRATVQHLLFHEKTVIEAERNRGKNNMLRHRVDIFIGTAAFIDSIAIKVEVRGKTPELLEASVVLIATGSSPRHPDNFPKCDNIFDSDDFVC